MSKTVKKSTVNKAGSKGGNIKDGGKLQGPSHDKGGIPIEAEGGEFIIKKDSVNPQTIKILEYINTYGDIPITDARKRGKK